MNEAERPTNRAATIAAATWAVIAGGCYYLGKFTPSPKGFQVIGEGIDARLDGGEHWAYGVGSAVWGIINNLPEYTPSIGNTDEVEPYLDGDDWDDDDSDYDDDSDGEVITYE